MGRNFWPRLYFWFYSGKFANISKRKVLVQLSYLYHSKPWKMSKGTVHRKTRKEKVKCIMELPLHSKISHRVQDLISLRQGWNSKRIKSRVRSNKRMNLLKWMNLIILKYQMSPYRLNVVYTQKKLYRFENQWYNSSENYSISAAKWIMSLY